MAAWDWIVQNGDGLAGISAGAAALLAVWGVYTTAKDSRDRTRPMVVAKIARELEADTSANLFVSNAGLSVARNVQVTFDPPVIDPGKADPDGFADHIRKRYERPIEIMPPGDVRQNLWQTYSLKEATIGTPNTTTVTISYLGPRGRRRYKDRYVLSIEDMKLETFVSASDNTVKGRLKAVAKNTETIGKELGKLSSKFESRP